MTRLARVLVVPSCCIWLATMGCGDGSTTAVKLAPVSGTVTYNGSPLAGARVTLYPDKGPLAMAETDLSGAYKLKSGALPGCAVGPAKATVSIPSESATTSTTLNPNPKTPEEMAENSKKMAEMTTSYQQTEGKKAKSLIPEKYKDPATSGLTFTIALGGSTDLKIELKD